MLTKTIIIIERILYCFLLAMMTMTMSNLVKKDTSDPATTQPYTRLTYPELPAIIEHINDEHFEELIGFLSVFSPLSTAQLTHVEVQLTTIYAEGMALQVSNKGTKDADFDSNDDTYFIPFSSHLTELDAFQHQYVLLKQKADKKRGKKTIKLTTQTFRVQDHYQVSKNMYRLVITPDSDATSYDPNSIPINEPGYAYLFDLEHNWQAISRKNNQSLPARPYCYYTLRKAWHTEAGSRAWVDVFIHGDTKGGNWAKALTVGDTVMSKREFPEKIEHLKTGQALLIADETSMPTVARLLELWDNPIPPLVVCVTQEAADQSYFDHIDISPMIADDLTVIPLVTHAINAGPDLAELIDGTVARYLAHHPHAIHNVWGALEASTAKSLRALLIERLNLSRSEVVVKVYWRHDSLS